jgi:cytochrome c-type biogenesis protein CcmH
MMIRRLFFALLLLPAVALAALDGFDTPQEEARFRSLSEQLRCLVCQGQSIADSNADLANDLKREVRRMILAGQTDAEIKDFMVARYGDFVLFKPPVKSSTYLLWFGPFGLLIIGLGVWFVLARRRQDEATTTLSAADKARLAQLLGDQEPRGDA